MRIFEPNNLINLLMKYIWQLADFPKFEYDATKLLSLIEESVVLIGEVRGIMKGFTPTLQDEVSAQVMLSEAIKTSEIEGEHFSREDVMSSLMMNLGLLDYALPSKNKNVDAIAQLMIEVKKNYNQPLTLELILHWHKILMSHHNNKGGSLRNSSEPMQVISGRYGDIKAHYEAPPSKDLPQLMGQFFEWYRTFEDSTLGTIGEAIILSALSHLYFETLHPFEDGNGRVGRAIADKVLAEKLESPLFISLSTSIENIKSAYYDEIKKAQRSLEVTDWLVYHIQVLIQALKQAVEVVQFVRKKTEFYDRYNAELNERQKRQSIKCLIKECLVSKVG
ncbi:MAG: Fic family protein [Clostridiaceae bacterium]|nr:Fic family protein [Clostridiaceae bacterium]